MLITIAVAITPPRMCAVPEPYQNENTSEFNIEYRFSPRWLFEVEAGNLGTGASVTPGFNGSWTGSNPVPTQFRLNGTVCTGSIDTTTTTTTTTTTSTTTSTTTTTTTTGNNPGGPRVDNPYVGAGVYVNPQWSRLAAAEPGGSRISNQPTGVWLDRISAIAGNGSPTTGSMGLADHLNEAEKQRAARSDGQLVFQFVVYNLPGRDCGGHSGGGTVLVGGDYQGKNADVQNAWRTYVSADSTLRADALAPPGVEHFARGFAAAQPRGLQAEREEQLLGEGVGQAVDAVVVESTGEVLRHRHVVVGLIAVDDEHQPVDRLEALVALQNAGTPIDVIVTMSA